MPAHRLETRRVAGSGGGRHHRAEVAPPPDARPTARRVPGHTPWAAGGPKPGGVPAMRAPSPSPNIDHERSDRLRSPRRVGVDRQSRRSLVLGGALVIAILGGAGAVAWAAKPAAPPPAVSVDTGINTGPDDASNSPANREPPLTDASPSTGAAGPAAGSAVAGTAVDPATDQKPDPAVANPEPQDGEAPAPTGFGPATVSPLGPGDAGFGWPSTAFGTIAAGPGT